MIVEDRKGMHTLDSLSEFSGIAALDIDEFIM